MIHGLLGDLEGLEDLGNLEELEGLEDLGCKGTTFLGDMQGKKKKERGGALFSIMNYEL